MQHETLREREAVEVRAVIEAYREAAARLDAIGSTYAAPLERQADELDRFAAQLAPHLCQRVGNLIVGPWKGVD
jgi:hypothetical protein